MYLYIFLSPLAVPIIFIVDCNIYVDVVGYEHISHSLFWRSLLFAIYVNVCLLSLSQSSVDPNFSCLNIMCKYLFYDLRLMSHFII